MMMIDENKKPGSLFKNNFKQGDNVLRFVLIKIKCQSYLRKGRLTRVITDFNLFQSTFNTTIRNFHLKRMTPDFNLFQSKCSDTLTLERKKQRGQFLK